MKNWGQVVTWRARACARSGVALVALFAAFPGHAGAAQSRWPLTPGSLATDGPIIDMASLGNSVYVTGDFSQIGRFYGSGVAVDPATGAPNQSFPALNGQISFVLANGRGGWYVGGDFTEVGGVPRKGLAEITPNGALDPSFAPQVNGLVDSLALDGSRLFLGGLFDHVDGQVREGVASVDARTGGLLPFDAHQTGSATELTFLPAAGTHPSVLYVGMGQVLALNPITGSPVPGFNSNIVGDIEALAVDVHHLYVGGEGLVALDPMTGAQDTRFNPIPINLSGQPQFTGNVFSIVPQPGRLLVGGSFNALGGAAGPLVALDLDTGSADRGFRPQVDGQIYDMSQSGRTLWVAGSFDRVGGLPAGNLVALSATTGIRDQAVAPRFNGQVNGVRAGAGSIFAGGQFYLVNASRSNGFAQVQGSTGALNPAFHPRAPNSPTITTGGNRLVAATDQFQGYDPRDRRHPYEPTRSTIDVLDPVTGVPTHAFHLRGVRNLSGIAVSRSSLFVAQRVESNIRFPHNVVTVYDIHTGRVQHRWRVPLSGYIAQLTVADGRLYAAGSFKRTRPSGQAANLAISALDPATGRLLTTFDAHADGPVYALAPKGRQLYLAGLFGQVGGSPRGGLAAVDVANGGLDRNFSPTIKAGNNTTLTPLPQDLFLQNPFGALFVRYDNGALNPHAAGGLRRFITATAARPGGLLVGGTILTPLQGQGATDLNFVRTTPAGGG